MMTLRAFDPDAASRADWAAVNRFRRMRSYEDAPDDPLLDDSEFERQLRHRWPLYENRRWYAWEGDDIVGSGGASFRRAGTDDDGEHAPFVYAWGGVRTSCRRRGIGMRLLAPLLGLMRERDKRVATFETFVSDGHAFLAAIGATLKHRQIESRVSLDSIDWSMLTAWHGVAIPADPPLRWEIHSHRVPRERMEVLNPQFESLMADMPLGEIDSPPIRSELAAWLAWYEDLDRYGGDHSLVMLMDGDAIAAICETAWDARFPDRVEQKLTAVSRRWRGRGFGKAVKAAMLRLIRERRPEVRTITTSNANVNAPMLSINARLGFVEHRRTATYQIGLDALSEVLRRRTEPR